MDWNDVEVQLPQVEINPTMKVLRSHDNNRLCNMQQIFLANKRTLPGWAAEHTLINSFTHFDLLFAQFNQDRKNKHTQKLREKQNCVFFFFFC